MSQGSPEKQSPQDIKGNTLWKIGSRDYGGWEVPQPNDCKPETQESRYDSVSLKPENHGSNKVNPSLRTAGGELRWHETLQFTQPGWEKKTSPIFYLFVLSRSSTDWVTPLPLGRNNPCEANLIRKPPHRHSQKCLTRQISGRPLIQFGWHLKLTTTLTSYSGKPCPVFANLQSGKNVFMLL